VREESDYSRYWYGYPRRKSDIVKPVDD
jgi:hypothetical protein